MSEISALKKEPYVSEGLKVVENKPYVPVESDFRLKGKTADDFVDTNFASQNFWKEVVARFKRKKSAVFGLIFVLVIIFFAFVGPVMNEYTYSGQNLELKNLAPRIPIVEYTGFFDGHENIKTTSGTKTVNYYFEKKLPDTVYWFGSDNFGFTHNRSSSCDHRYDHWNELWSYLRILWRQSGYGDAENT